MARSDRYPVAHALAFHAHGKKVMDDCREHIDTEAQVRDIGVKLTLFCEKLIIAIAPMKEAFEKLGVSRDNEYGTIAAKCGDEIFALIEATGEDIMPPDAADNVIWRSFEHVQR
eukprot:9492934-Pyramimonas_sp.AAC.1